MVALPVPSNRTYGPAGTTSKPPTAKVSLIASDVVFNSKSKVAALAKAPAAIVTPPPMRPATPPVRTKSAPLPPVMVTTAGDPIVAPTPVAEIFNTCAPPPLAVRSIPKLPVRANPETFSVTGLPTTVRLAGASSKVTAKFPLNDAPGTLSATVPETLPVIPVSVIESEPEPFRNSARAGAPISKCTFVALMESAGDVP